MFSCRVFARLKRETSIHRVHKNIVDLFLMLSPIRSDACHLAVLTVCIGRLKDFYNGKTVNTHTQKENWDQSHQKLWNWTTVDSGMCSTLECEFGR